MNKLIGVMLMMFSVSVLADHTITHNVEEAIEKGIFKTEEFAYCRTKAKMGHQVHLDKEVYTVDFQISEVLRENRSMAEEDKMPWWLVVEMQRIVRGAHRFKGTAEEYYTEVFEDCALSGY